MIELDQHTAALLRYINEELLFGDGEASVEEDLLESGLLDSINIFGLVQFVRDTFELEVPPPDIVIENFGSVAQIAEYVASRKGRV